MYIPFYIPFIALSLLFSIVYNLQERRELLYQRLFPFYLTITLTIESLAVYFWSQDKTNVSLYNFFGVFEFLFYFFMLHQIMHSKTVKRIIKAIGFIYPIAFLININFIQTEGFHSMTYSLGCLLVVAICIYYFFELFQSSHSVVLIREPAFWFCTGLLFFYCCTFPFFGLANFMENLPLIIMDNISALLNLMNSLLYSLFTIAFLCRIRIRKST
ncbi:hypothetical protein [Flavitalea antarctica]